MPFVSDLVRGNPRYDGTPLYYHFKNIPETSPAPFFHLSFFPLCSPFALPRYFTRESSQARVFFDLRSIN